jgi:hypothetical protein
MSMGSKLVHAVASMMKTVTVIMRMAVLTIRTPALIMKTATLNIHTGALMM